MTTTKFSFCESTFAGPLSLWHLRKLSDLGPFYNGGIDTPSLCERVRPIGTAGHGGWDLRVEITPHHLAMNTCDTCRKAYEERAKR